MSAWFAALAAKLSEKYIDKFLVWARIKLGEGWKWVLKNTVEKFEEKKDTKEYKDAINNPNATREERKNAEDDRFHRN